MSPDEIVLENLNKMLVYEQQSRIIDKMNIDELRLYAKLYCKLYLKQQEVLKAI